MKGALDAFFLNQLSGRCTQGLAISQRSKRCLDGSSTSMSPIRIAMAPWSGKRSHRHARECQGNAGDVSPVAARVSGPSRSNDLG